MNKSNPGELKRGQTISFRVPSDTPDHLIKHLQKLKEEERRNFSGKIAEFVMQGVGNSYSKEKETITIPLPHKIGKSQRDWLKHEHSQALLGSIVYHLLTDPVRATSLLASLNSNSLDIDEALYLQEEARMEETAIHDFRMEETFDSMEETAVASELDVDNDDDDDDDDLSTFNWDSVKLNQSDEKEAQEEKEEDLDDLLGDFLAKMNK